MGAAPASSRSLGDLPGAFAMWAGLDQVLALELEPSINVLH
jgi:hypothetical protein